MITNQLKRQNEEVAKMRETLDAKNVSEYKLQSQLREAQRKHAELESRMKEDIMMARIRDAENTQSVAELTQKISSLEYKVKIPLGILSKNHIFSNKIYCFRNVFSKYFFNLRTKRC